MMVSGRSRERRRFSEHIRKSILSTFKLRHMWGIKGEVSGKHLDVYKSDSQRRHLGGPYEYASYQHKNGVRKFLEWMKYLGEEYM